MKTRILYLMLFASSVMFAQIPTNGLIAQYEFTNGSLVDGANSINLNQIGTALTPVNDRAGNVNDAISLNGDHLSRADLNTGESISYSFWVKTSTDNLDLKTIIDDSQKNGGSNNFTSTQTGYTIMLNRGKIVANARVSYSAGVGVTGFQTRTANSRFIADGNWHHIIVRFFVYRPSGTQNKWARAIVDVDGVRDNDDNRSLPTTTGAGGLNTSGNVAIGHNRNQTINSNLRYTDIIDDVLVYNRGLTQQEILDIGEEGGFCFTPDRTSFSTRFITEDKVNVILPAAPAVYDIAYHKSTEPFANAMIVSKTVNSVSRIIDITGLTASTTYNIYIRKNCSSGTTSSWSQANSFRTLGTTYVNTAATGLNDGSSWTNAYNDLRTALLIVNPDSEIWVATGTYKPDPTDRAIDFPVIKENLKVYGGFAGTETTIDQRVIGTNETILSGDLMDNDVNTADFASNYANTTRNNDNSFHLIDIASTGNNLLLDGLTISDVHTNVSGTERGGAILKEKTISKLKLKNCIVKDNVSRNDNAGLVAEFELNNLGGARGSLVIENCQFVNNMSRWASGVYVFVRSTTNVDVTIANSLFDGNIAGDLSSTLKGLSGSAAWIRMIGNNSNSNVSIFGNVYVNNIDNGTDQGLNNFSRAPMGISKSNVSGILNATVSNSIFWGNMSGSVTARSITDHYKNSVNSLNIYNAIDELNFNDDSITSTTATSDTDPMFTDFANGDYTLTTGSPAIDSGDTTKVFGATDLAGNVRIHNTTVDMGVYEFGSSAPILQRTLTINATNGTVATNPNPTNGTYDDGTSVVLTATPDTGYQFDGWSGDTTGTTNPLSITMDADKTVTAIFSAIQRTLIINATNGTVTTNPNPTNGAYNSGTLVDLVAIPDTGYQFDGWSGAATGNANPYTILMDTDKTVTAIFSVIQRALTVNATNGTVTTNPNPTNGTYDEGTSVILTATAATGYQFDGWSGDATGVSNPLTITMDADKTVTAVFSAIQHTLIITAANGLVVTNPNPTNGSYDYGTSVVLTATPDTGYQFDGWSGDATGVSNPLTITMDTDKTVTAVFSAIQHTLIITSANGSVVTNPNPTNGTYDEGTSVVLTATPAAGYQFDGWSGDATSSNNLLTITMDVDKTVTAIFSAIQRALTVNATNGTVTTNPNQTNGTYDEGTSVVLTATPAAGYQFDGWSGDATGVSNPLTITMDVDKTVTAIFSDPTLGINNNKLLNFVMFPNPSSQYLNIQTDEVIEEIAIYTLLGTKVNHSIENTKRIDVSDLSNGVYFINIKTPKGTSTKRFIKS